MNQTAHLKQSMGKVFRELVKKESPVQIIGTINAYSAILAEKAGHKVVYLSGSGVATASYGLPDLGITTLNDVVEDARRITRVSGLPLVVDIDTGFGTAFNIARCIQEMERAGVAAVHMEDQVSAKRCGHRPKKQIVSQEEMEDRIKVAVNARTDPNFVIMARTDSLASEGIDKAIQRCKGYVEAGADMIFAEACQTLQEYKQFVDALKVPILANITEFGKTPLFTKEELGSVGVSMVLYPLSGFRAMSKACMDVYQAIKADGSQKNVLDQMHTRSQYYDYIDYHKYEKQLDQFFEKKN